MRKIFMILICAGVLGLSAMTASAEERQIDQNPMGDVQTTDEPVLIAPNPDNGSDDQMLISPNPDSADEGSEQSLISPSPSASVEKSDILATAGIPIFGAIVAIALAAIALAAIALVVLYKRK